MPKMPDAQIVVTGQPLVIEPRKDFETKAANGADVSVLGPSGFAIVRFSQEDVVSSHLPEIGKQCALVASGSSWAMGAGASNVVYRYVRRANVNDVEQLHKQVQAAQTDAGSEKRAA